MTAYTSGKTHRDPEPWLGDPGRTNTPNRYGSRETGEGAPFWDDVEFAPRPEFDNHNPILVELRESERQTDAEWSRRVFRLGAVDDRATPQIVRDAWADATEAHRDHARRVLSKLAALA